jgi:hypothetical protein
MDLYGAIGVKAVVSRHLLVRLASGISSSRPDFRAAAARSGRQWWPKAIAQRLALDGREHSVRLSRRGDRACRFLARSVSTAATIPRGARHRVAHISRATNLYSADPEGSQPRCSHAHRRRSSEAAGPF